MPNSVVQLCRPPDDTAANCRSPAAWSRCVAAARDPPGPTRHDRTGPPQRHPQGSLAASRPAIPQVPRCTVDRDGRCTRRLGPRPGRRRRPRTIRRVDGQAAQSAPGIGVWNVRRSSAPCGSGSCSSSCWPSRSPPSSAAEASTRTSRPRPRSRSSTTATSRTRRSTTRNRRSTSTCATRSTAPRRSRRSTRSVPPTTSTTWSRAPATPTASTSTPTSPRRACSSASW